MEKLLHLSLDSGDFIPALGLGTWQAKPEKVEQAVRHAVITCGYRHIDCAALYFNEKNVGAAIASILKEAGKKL